MNVTSSSSADSPHAGGSSVLNGIVGSKCNHIESNKTSTGRTKKSKKKSKAGGSVTTTNVEHPTLLPPTSSSSSPLTTVDAINAVTSALDARLSLKQTTINGKQEQKVSAVVGTSSAALSDRIDATDDVAIDKPTDKQSSIMCNGSTATEHGTDRASSVVTESQRTELSSTLPDEITSQESNQVVVTETILGTNNNNIVKENDEKAGCSETIIEYLEYENELQMPDIIRLIQKDLSEPYSIYTYRYFIHNWPKLCFLAMYGTKCVGAIVCKLDIHRQIIKRGYIAMLAVDKEYRKLKIGTNLVQKAIQAMLVYNADEVVLETEITNIPALRLYENLGFVRDKRLFGYYLNGVDALRLKLWFR